jgi:hypothetical protein
MLPTLRRLLIFDEPGKNQTQVKDDNVEKFDIQGVVVSGKRRPT